MQRRIPAVIMRGGTSKAVFFKESHLPSDPGIRDKVILAAFGSPDPYRRQVDGLGGAVSTTSKVAIISVSSDPAYDVVYLFGQVSIDRPLVDYKGNCGNISSAVGPFAVDEGLVPVTEPVTKVRIYQKNTNKLIIAEVPVHNGIFNEEGDFSIPGVPGTGSKIALRFVDPGGSVTGALFPTGNLRDTVTLAGKKFEVTIIDASNPCVFVKAKSLGLTGAEKEEIENSRELKDLIEAIRANAAVRLGLTSTPEEATVSCQAVPKIGIVSEPIPYTTWANTLVDPESVHLCARMMSMGTLHASFPVSGSISLAAAARIQGTVVNDCLKRNLPEEDILIGHPGGIMPVGVSIDVTPGSPRVTEAVIYRTARRLMEGYVFVPEKFFHAG
ncbi:2-methylaconitate cis-trans isomerase PrpF family protein [Thermodesulforhabdus norvegica]|uniref:3-methylitaconate isomerase n=1 Tax=Thermodesulforhabdus norvegica TaxID=39841 RepID=A0A1I4QGU2_9BACT|nr:PrpF domain-containing protein [Thermodesulforhabdus norvegica]SFM38833.1 hypothetical protein SAMN05660836_00011 [Thermodesulforhabdus norvegica]